MDVQPDITRDLSPAGRLFDIGLVPTSEVSIEPPGEKVWCTGSGVPGDNCEFGHPVSTQFDPDIVWIENRDRRRGEEFLSVKPRCRRCEQVLRNYRDSVDEDLTKAKDWWYSHAKKCAAWWQITPKEARERFILRGVIPEAIAEMFRHSRGHGSCPSWQRGGCGLGFDDGRHDITGDIKDPQAVRERGYLTLEDIHGMCKSCNLAKGEMAWLDWLTYCAFHHWCEQYRPPGWQQRLES